MTAADAPPTESEDPATTVPSVPVDPALARHLSRAAAKQREWRERRDDLIRDAVEDGGSLREVAELVGLSHTAVAKIVHRGLQG